MQPRKRGRQLQVGVTGGIGSGKSLVCRFFASMGIPWYDADLRAKALYLENGQLKEKVMAAFGTDLYNADGSFNAPLLAKRALEDPAKTAQLNALVHPLVFADYRAWVAANHAAPYLIKEAALLYESGSYKDLDETILVQAPVEDKLARIMARDPARGRAQIEAIMARQWPDEQKQKLATYIIDNGNSTMLMPTLLQLHQTFLRKAVAMQQILEHPQVASAIFMVRPVDFNFNEQTAVDNEFQHRPDPEAQDVNRAALAEFENAVQLLRKNGVNVIVLEGATSGVKTPDAVFPNNWISTRADGQVFLYPMATENRRAETRRLPEVLDLFKDHRMQVAQVVDYTTEWVTPEQYLEGTGSLVFDHKLRIVYASISHRTHPELVAQKAHNMGYEACLFDTESLTGKAYYHTNVVMSVGNHFAVICAEAIPEEAQRREVLRKLGQDREVICITREQAEKKFCANILQINNREGQPLIVMSNSAYHGFTAAERTRLELYGKLVALDIPIIENVGGGSARCMMAEVFLPPA